MLRSEEGGGRGGRLAGLGEHWLMIGHSGIFKNADTPSPLLLEQLLKGEGRCSRTAAPTVASGED